MESSSIIVAIGGGEINKSDTTVIDREILALTKNKSASMLFIPTASSDAQDYSQAIRHYFKEVGFSSVDVLNLIDTNLTKSQIERVVLSYQAIYVGGGNTLQMMNIWKKLGVDSILKRALQKGIVLSGLSAGSMCWFSQGISDSEQQNDGKMHYKIVSGLNFINAIHCPHFSNKSYYRHAIKAATKNSSKVAICLEDSVALITVGNTYRIIKSKATAKAYRAYWKNKEYFLEEIALSDSLRNIDELLTK